MNQDPQDLFQAEAAERRQRQSPLANRMRPQTLDDYVGQEHIIGPGRLLRRSIEADQLSSLILYGPPGTGKTTLASVIANTSSSAFVTLNAVLAGVKVLREEIEAAGHRFAYQRQRTTLFVDEVHRWNKAQQDALLPHVENGAIIFIGATTENPFFEVIKPLVSRSRVFQLRPLEDEAVSTLLTRALEDPDTGFGRRPVSLEDEARQHLVHMANGDARSALNALELAVNTTAAGRDGVIRIDLATAEESIQRRAVLYDKQGDAHYDAVSALIKSLRGSDPDAALYWAAKMVYAGEDPSFLFRRMAILASEDIGLADPQAVAVVDSCWSLFERIGLPEGLYPLSQAVLYLATASKSNSAMAIFAALEAVEQEKDQEVPTSLKDGNRDATAFGHGAGYLYPHAYRDHWVAQQYLPAGLEGRVFYEPGSLGHEAAIRDRVLRRREELLAAAPEQADAPAEVITYSPEDPDREDWLRRAGNAASRHLGTVRDAICTGADMQRHDRVLVVRADNGLLLAEACRAVPEGGVWGEVSSSEAATQLNLRYSELPALDRPVLTTGLEKLDPELRFECVLGMDMLGGPPEAEVLLAALTNVLADDGRLVFSQSLPLMGQRVHSLLNFRPGDKLGTLLREVEEDLWVNHPNPALCWTEADLRDLLARLRLAAEFDMRETVDRRFLSVKQLRSWFNPQSALGTALGRKGLSSDDLKGLSLRMERELGNQTVPWQRVTALVVAKHHSLNARRGGTWGG